MNVHQNSIRTQGLFKGLEALKNEDLIDFDLERPQQDALSQTLWECLIYGWDKFFSPDPKGPFLFNAEKWVAKSGVFDFGSYLEEVSRRFESCLPSVTDFDKKQVAASVKTVQLALFYQFKLMFQESPKGNVICFGGAIMPISQPFDYFNYAESVFKTFCSFI